MKKILILLIAVVLLTGAVHAEDVNSTLELKKTSLDVNKVSGKEKTKVKIRATLRDENGKAVKNARLTFKIKGKSFTKNTDSKGKASLTYKLPKAKYVKSKESEKGKIITKKKIYKTDIPVKVTFSGNEKYKSCEKSTKITSKKTVTRKYRYERIVKSEVVPVKKGDHSYKRGPVIIQVIKGKDDLWTAVDTKDHNLRLQISTKIHYKEHGKWRWEKKWHHMPSENDWIGYYYKSPKSDLIKVRYELPRYIPLK